MLFLVAGVVLSKGHVLYLLYIFSENVTKKIYIYLYIKGEFINHVTSVEMLRPDCRVTKQLKGRRTVKSRFAKWLLHHEPRFPKMTQIYTSSNLKTLS